MLMDDHLRRLVRADTESGVLRSASLAHGMRSLRLSGAGKVAAGLTTIEEVVSVIQSDYTTG
jgi:general secretion pathway protein E